MPPKSDIYDREDIDPHAVDEAFDILDDVFQTGYTTTQTPAVDSGREGSSWWFKFDAGGDRYHFEWDLYSGTVWLQRREDDGYQTLIKTSGR